MDIDVIINKYTDKFNEEIKKVLEQIQTYPRIILFRHILPDYDAMGSQMGLYYWLKANFPQKEIYYVGENHVTLMGQCFPLTQEISDDLFDKNTLSIITDTASEKRISDERYKQTAYLIKIDHHHIVDKLNFGDIQIIDENLASASELVMAVLLKMGKEFTMPKASLEMFFKGIIGDTNRYLYSGVNDLTFALSLLISQGEVDIYQAYQEMYNKNHNEFYIKKYILDHMQFTPRGVGYYILTMEELNKLHLPPELAKDYLDLFEFIDGLPIWLSVSYNPKSQNYRVSIRSSGISLIEVASLYRGGGHENAVGARLTNLDELPLLLKDLDALIG